MLNSHLANIDSIIFGLQELGCIRREMVCVQKLLTTGFVQSLWNNIYKI